MLRFWDFPLLLAVLATSIELVTPPTALVFLATWRTHCSCSSVVRVHYSLLPANCLRIAFDPHSETHAQNQSLGLQNPVKSRYNRGILLLTFSNNRKSFFIKYFIEKNINDHKNQISLYSVTKNQKKKLIRESIKKNWIPIFFLKLPTISNDKFLKYNISERCLRSALW